MIDIWYLLSYLLAFNLAWEFQKLVETFPEFYTTIFYKKNSYRDVVPSWLTPPRTSLIYFYTNLDGNFSSYHVSTIPDACFRAIETVIANTWERDFLMNSIDPTDCWTRSYIRGGRFSSTLYNIFTALRFYPVFSSANAPRTQSGNIRYSGHTIMKKSACIIDRHKWV